MRIESTEDNVKGFVEYNSDFGEDCVISLWVENGKIKVGSSTSLPVRHEQAKLILACYSEAFKVAEAKLGDL